MGKKPVSERDFDFMKGDTLSFTFSDGTTLTRTVKTVVLDEGNTHIDFRNSSRGLYKPKGSQEYRAKKDHVDCGSVTVKRIV